jgi:phage terminase large subunit
MELTEKQTIALDFLEDCNTQEVYYGGAAGGGKSVLGCYWLAKMCFKYPASRWLMGRSELKNLKKTTLNSFFEVAKEQGLKADIHYKLNHQDSIITFPNASQILMADLHAYPSDPEFDSLGSLEITGAFIDEASQVTEKAKNIVKSRIRYKLNEFKLIPKMLMCGNPSKNWSYNEFYKPTKEGTLRKDRQFVQALPGDNRHLPESYLDSLRGLDKNSRERLLMGNWEYDDDPSSLIDYENILNCFSNEFVDVGNGFITVDVARFGSDKTVLGIWSGWRVKLMSFSGLSVDKVAGQIREAQLKYRIANSNTIADHYLTR